LLGITPHMATAEIQTRTDMVTLAARNSCCIERWENACRISFV